MATSKKEPLIKVGEHKQIYQGSKTYWKTNEVIDLAIFEHHAPSNAVTKNSTYWIEIVAYNPTLDVEAPHLYLSSDVLCERFNEKAKNSSAGNLLFAYSEDVQPGEKLSHKLYLKYIFNRIAIKGEEGDEGATEEERSLKVRDKNSVPTHSCFTRVLITPVSCWSNEQNTHRRSRASLKRRGSLPSRCAPKATRNGRTPRPSSRWTSRWA